MGDSTPGGNDEAGGATAQAVNLRDKLAQFDDHYQPRTIGEFNGNDLMVVKAKGPFVWHKHEHTDDFPRP